MIVDWLAFFCRDLYSVQQTTPDVVTTRNDVIVLTTPATTAAKTAAKTAAAAAVAAATHAQTAEQPNALDMMTVMTDRPNVTILKYCYTVRMLL